ncbi:DNA-binding SARP family transcriptional activator [Kitasatospora sp. MAA4]|uniref:AfsR/SARP family transcriptional regulator n=1 Tax=Kitasatospora sp. MAA4 TaxID=3035093 RepID=UPI002475FEE7|nr:AfsR/SARP family transcriptional regulator [Kitasatospora sp. MAA4]MDH6132394.1 DNA-binding SARP family transcriptional activator [Kitasatospora sp. MAA4]
MYFEVFGGLAITDVDGRHLPTAPKQRQLLGLLLLHANRTVSVGTCISELWGETPPESATTTLQTYVMHLRRLLARLPSVGSKELAHRRLEIQGQGYVLRVGREECDLFRFERQVAEARQVLAGDEERGCRLLAAALALWPRPVLADVRTGPVLEPAVTHLELLRLAALEQYLDTELRLGRHRRILAELAVLVRQYPTNEQLHGQFMLALYRCGRPAEALAVQTRLRASLADELGVEPSWRIRELQRVICAGESAPEQVPGPFAVV